MPITNHGWSKYGLDPATTKAYGDPTAMSLDPEIDLVVCCTRVDTHYKLTKPAIEAGKATFVEWPLTHDVERSRELTVLAAKKGSRSMVGFQGQLTPVTLKIKELLHEGSVGKVLSSEVRAHGGTNDREKVAEGLRYFTDRKIGGNIFMIGFAHCEFQTACPECACIVGALSTDCFFQCLIMCKLSWFVHVAKDIPVPWEPLTNK